jgi:hypothetical protein
MIERFEAGSVRYLRLTNLDADSGGLKYMDPDPDADPDPQHFF